MELSNQNIDKTVEDIRSFFQRADVAPKDVLKICLVAEEALLRWQERFGANKDFQLYTRKWFGAPKITIRLKGQPFNPLDNTQEDDSIFSSEIMQNLLHHETASTVYRYENGCNEFVAISTKERKPLKIPGGSITVAILLAIGCSFLFGYLPADITATLLDDFINPLLSTLMSLIVTVTVFMVFFSIVSSICAIENTTMLGNIGVPVIRGFFLFDLLIIVLTIFISLMFFPVLSVDGGGNAHDLGKISELLLSTVPTNFFDAFVKRNVPQVIIMAFFVGLCIIMLGNRISNIKSIVNEFNLLMFQIMELVFETIPLLIFLCIVKTLMTSSVGQVLSVWKILAANCLAYGAFTLFMLIRLRLKTSIKLADFFKKIFPAFIVSLTTGSSSAALPKSLEVSKENLHVDEKFCNFWIPLSLVLFSPSKLIQLTVSVFYVAFVTNDNIAVAELFIIAFLAIQMSISSPSVGGGIAASFSIMLTQMELPLEYIGSLMIADVVTGNIFTAVNVLLRECELMVAADKMNFLNKA